MFEPGTPGACTHKGVPTRHAGLESPAYGPPDKNTFQHTGVGDGIAVTYPPKGCSSLAPCAGLVTTSPLPRRKPCSAMLLDRLSGLFKASLYLDGLERPSHIHHKETPCAN